MNQESIISGTNEHQAWLKTVKPGSVVWWNDPALGQLSDLYTVQEMEAPDGVCQADSELTLVSKLHGEVYASASEISPCQPADLYPIVDRDRFIRSFASSKEQAQAFGAALFAEPTDEFELLDNVTLSDGRELPKAWAQRPPKLAQVRLTLDVTYVLNGETAEDMGKHLQRAVQHVIGGGLLTGDSMAEVDSHTSSVNVVEALQPEDTLAAFMLSRIENADIALEDIPNRLARYGLMDPYAFSQEMSERMAQAQSE